MAYLDPIQTDSCVMNNRDMKHMNKVSSSTLARINLDSCLSFFKQLSRKKSTLKTPFNTLSIPKPAIYGNFN